MYCISLLFVALFSSLLASIASPVPETFANSTVIGFEKRITHVGRGTWFHVGLGNCGYWNVDSDAIVAISIERYNENDGANCNQWVQIVNTQNGKVAYGKTRDSCESCGTSDLDMSPSLFEQLDPLSVGELKISWHFMAMGWAP